MGSWIGLIGMNSDTRPFWQTWSDRPKQFFKYPRVYVIPPLINIELTETRIKSNFSQLRLSFELPVKKIAKIACAYSLQFFLIICSCSIIFLQPNTTIFFWFNIALDFTLCKKVTSSCKTTFKMCILSPKYKKIWFPNSDPTPLSV